MLNIRILAVIGAATLFMVGCESPQPMDMSSMQPPPRAPELDKLGLLIGSWEGSGECVMPGAEGPMKNTGKSSITWEADRTVALERFEGSMGESKFSGLGLWTWDPSAKKYKVFWTDNYGSQSHGEATFDEATRTWKMAMKNAGPMGNTSGSGTTRLVDDNTMEWSYTEWNALKTKKTMEMKGTSKRVR